MLRPVIADNAPAMTDLGAKAPGVEAAALAADKAELRAAVERLSLAAERHELEKAGALIAAGGSRLGPANSPFDSGIASAVCALLDAGIDTFESCQGGRGHAFERPTVRFHGGPDAGWRALSICLSHGFAVRSLERYWTVCDGHEPNGPEWQITFRNRS